MKVAPRQAKKDENHYFRVVFEDGFKGGSEVVWGFHPAVLRGDHMGRRFASGGARLAAKPDAFALLAKLHCGDH